MSLITARIVRPLDVPLIIHSSVGGATAEVVLSKVTGTLHVPLVLHGDDQGRLTVDAPEGFTKASPVLPNSMLGWGGYSAPNQASLNGLGFQFQANIDTAGRDFESLSVSGLDEIHQELSSWIRRFCRWTQLILNQPLDLSDPAPGVISLPSSAALSWGELDGAESLMSSSPPPFAISVEFGTTPVSERLMEHVDFGAITELTNDPARIAPVEVQFLGTSRLAVQRGRLRQCLIEVGIGLEALLTRILGLNTGHKKTLGNLVDDAANAGLSLPGDIKANLVTPRNDSVHRGADPSRQVALRAVEILDSLIRIYTPGFSFDITRVRAHRPHRLDLNIIRSK
jgi:hypothetical protein